MDTSNPSLPRGKSPALKGPLKNKGGKGRSKAAEAHSFLVSIAAKEESAPFAVRKGGKRVLTERGRIVADCWRGLGEGHPAIETGTVSIGPRLVRGILRIRSAEKDSTTLADAVRLFKSLSARSLPGPAAPASAVWKKAYAERHLATLKQVVEARGELDSLY